MAQIEQISEYQASMIVDDDENNHDSNSSESTSSTASVVSDQFDAFTGMSLLRLNENDMIYDLTRKMFAVGMKSAGVDAQVVAIHKNVHAGWTRRARQETFLIFQKAVAQKCGGNANIGYGWYGGSREEICDIVLHGFSGGREPGSHGVGVQLFSNKFSFDE